MSQSYLRTQKDIELLKNIYKIESLGNQNYRIKDGFRVHSAIMTTLIYGDIIQSV
jgi:hypothetical protein